MTRKPVDDPNLDSRIPEAIDDRVESDGVFRRLCAIVNEKSAKRPRGTLCVETVDADDGVEWPRLCRDARHNAIEPVSGPGRHEHEARRDPLVFPVNEQRLEPCATLGAGVD